MILKVFLRGFTRNKYGGYVKQWWYKRKTLTTLKSIMYWIF